MDSKLITELADLLRQQQGISGQITENSKVCGDLGVCDEDFQDYMKEVWRFFGLPSRGVVRLDIEEGQITLTDIARWIEDGK